MHRLGSVFAVRAKHLEANCRDYSQSLRPDASPLRLVLFFSDISLGRQTMVSKRNGSLTMQRFVLGQWQTSGDNEARDFWR